MSARRSSLSDGGGVGGHHVPARRPDRSRAEPDHRGGYRIRRSHACSGRHAHRRIKAESLVGCPRRHRGRPPFRDSARTEGIDTDILPASGSVAHRQTPSVGDVRPDLRHGAGRTSGSHRGQPGDPCTDAQGPLLQTKVPARTIRSGRKATVRVQIPKRVVRSLRATGRTSLRPRVLVTVWHDKDARKSRKGRDFRQTAFSNLADTSSGVFDPDDGGSGYTEDETIALSQTVDNASPFQITVTTQPNQCALGAGPGVGSGTPNTYVIEPGTSAQIDGLAPKRIGIPSADAGLLGSQVLQLGITAARGAVQAAAAAVMSGRNVRADQPASSTGSSTSDPGPTSSFESEAKSTATKATAGLVSGAESAAGPFLLGFFLDLIADSCAATGNKNPALWTMNVTTTGIGSGASIPFQSVNWQYAHGGADPYNPNPSSMSPQVARGLMGLTTNVIYEWADPGSDSETGTRSRAGAERAQDDNLVTLSGKQGAAVFDAGLTVIADWEYDSDDDKSCYFHTYLPAAFPGCHGEVKYFVGYDANSTAVSGPVRQGPATLLTTKYADGSVGLKCASPDWQMNLPWHLSMSGGSGTAGGSTQGPGLGDSYSMSQPPDSVPGAQGALMAGFWCNTESTTMSPFSNVPGFVVQAAQGTSLSEGGVPVHPGQQHRGRFRERADHAVRLLVEGLRRTAGHDGAVRNGEYGPGRSGPGPSHRLVVSAHSGSQPPGPGHHQHAHRVPHDRDRGRNRQRDRHGHPARCRQQPRDECVRGHHPDQFRPGHGVGCHRRRQRGIQGHCEQRGPRQGEGDRHPQRRAPDRHRQCHVHHRQPRPQHLAGVPDHRDRRRPRSGDGDCRTTRQRRQPVDSHRRGRG